jgi:hypothetical protein
MGIKPAWKGGAAPLLMSQLSGEIDQIVVKMLGASLDEEGIEVEEGDAEMPLPEVVAGSECESEEDELPEEPYSSDDDTPLYEIARRAAQAEADAEDDLPGSTLVNWKKCKKQMAVTLFTLS